MFERALYRSDMLRCALCQDAPCAAACGRLDPAALLRSVWFDDEKTAAQRLTAALPCAACDAPCEAACVRPGEVPIRGLMLRLRDEVAPRLEVAPPEDESRLRCDLWNCHWSSLGNWCHRNCNCLRWLFELYFCIF